MTAHMAAIFLAKVDRESFLQPIWYHSAVAGWPIKRMMVRRQKKGLGNVKHETEETRLDNVKVSTHRWWPFTAVSQLAVGRFIQRVSPGQAV